MALRGRDSTKTTFSGTLYWARYVPQCSITSAADTAAPGLVSTTAVSDHLPEPVVWQPDDGARPDLDEPFDDSFHLGWERRSPRPAGSTASSGREYGGSLRNRGSRCPRYAAPMTGRPPRHLGSNIRASACIRRPTHRVRAARTTTSPFCAIGSSRPSSSRIATLRCGRTLPLEPGTCPPRRDLMVTTVGASVSPCTMEL